MKVNDIQYDYSAITGFIISEPTLGTKKKYAEFLGISSTALNQKLKGKSSFSQDQIERTRVAFNLSDERLVNFFFCQRVSK